MMPIQSLSQSLSRQGVARFFQTLRDKYPDPETRLKDLSVEEVGPGREVVILGRRVVNFGSDSFLGLDRDDRVSESLIAGIRRWGSHYGSSRAFTSAGVCVRAEERIARWLGTEAALLFPSVTLANGGVIPALVTKKDVIVADEYAHNSMSEAIRIASSNGTRTFTFKHNDPIDLERALREARPYSHALIAIDGVYSMAGDLPPLEEFQEIADRNDGILYIDDAHGTGVMGANGRGTVAAFPDVMRKSLVIGSLSKGFSCFGAFVGCPLAMLDLLKMRSNTWIFGGPIPPCYMEAICTVLDILESDEYDKLMANLDRNRVLLVERATEQGWHVLGGETPIVSLFVGDEDDTLKAGQYLFQRGFFTQSVTFPAVPFRCGVLRIQVNANHTEAEVLGLTEALGELIAMSATEATAAA